MEYTHRENLCEGLYGTGDIYPNKDYNPYFAAEDYKKLLVEAGDDPDKKRRAIQKTAPATYYTCASKADGITTFPCTGSKHKEGAHILCSCDCHVYEEQTDTPNKVLPENKYPAQEVKSRFSNWCTGCHGCSECKPL